MDEKKFYSFLNTQRCITKEGNEYVGCTVVLTASNIETKTTEAGKKLTTARGCINNRGKLLSTVLGKEVVESENGAVWCDITFWEDKSERFCKFIKDREKTKICIVGTLSLREFEKNDGTPGQRVTINATDWFAVPSNNS